LFIKYVITSVALIAVPLLPSVSYHAGGLVLQLHRADAVRADVIAATFFAKPRPFTRFDLLRK
jgi:hypothetical protein